MKSNYLDFNKYVPNHDLPLVVDTNFGQRYGKFMWDSWSFILTDCTSPMQNCRISQYDVKGWKYRNTSLHSELELIPNTYERRKEAEKVLTSFKLSLWDKIKLWLK